LKTEKKNRENYRQEAEKKEAIALQKIQDLEKRVLELEQVVSHHALLTPYRDCRALWHQPIISQAVGCMLKTVPKLSEK